MRILKLIAGLILLGGAAWATVRTYKGRGISSIFVLAFAVFLVALGLSFLFGAFGALVRHPDVFQLLAPFREEQGESLSRLLPTGLARHYRRIGRYAFPMLVVLLVILPLLSPRANIVARLVSPHQVFNLAYGH